MASPVAREILGINLSREGEIAFAKNFLKCLLCDRLAAGSTAPSPIVFAPSMTYFAMQTFFGSVKKRRASSPPSRPTPLCFMPHREEIFGPVITITPFDISKC